MITGYYSDSIQLRGFVRASDGTITTFDPLGSTNTIPGGINDWGVITGTYNDGSQQRGFVRASDGTITTLTRSAPPKRIRERSMILV